MAAETLSVALSLMFGHEGGYSNHPRDPGGPTKYGVTLATLRAHRRRATTADDVKALTLSEAEQIYRKNYWHQAGADRLAVGLDYAVFDFSVNSGPSRAVKELQRIVGVAMDGIIGDKTLAAVHSYKGGTSALINAYCDRRLAFMRSLKTWSAFGKGWSRRVAEVRAAALKMAAGAKPTANPGLTPTETAKAPQSDKAVTDILKKPEAWGPIGGVLSGFAAIASGTGPIQWALAFLMVVAVLVGVYFVVKRVRSE